MLYSNAVTFLKIVTGSDQEDLKEETIRDIFVITIGLLAICVLLAVGSASAFQGEMRVAFVDYLASVFLIGLIAFYRFTGYKRACQYIGVGMMYVLYLYLFLTEASGGVTYMWHYTFPFFAIFLIGAEYGALATIALYLPVFAFVITDARTPDSGLYSIVFAIRFIPSVTVALIFAYLFEKERKRFQRQMLKAYREQESIIEERTRQLKEETAVRENIADKLRQSQKMEAIGTMASGVAHDLNNILSGVVTYPELIRLDLPPDSPLHTPLTTMEQSGKRAAAVVSDLLTLARNAASVKEEVDANRLIDEFLSTPEWLGITGSYSRVRICSEICAVNPVVHCSPSHVRKCVMNLLVNAVEATAPDGVVTIKTFNASAATLPGTEIEDALVVSVADQGPGIEQQHLGHIFEPFYTTKRMGRSGSGLGLAVVWSTMEEHGGTVTVESTDSGAVFFLWFPVSGRLVKTTQYEELPLEQYRGKGNILIVDDEAPLREIAVQIVEKLGYTATAVESGEDAVAHIRENSVDLILLDMVLGEGMGGFETYREVMKIRPGQRALIVSGYATNTDVDKTLALGASGIVSKPYSLRDLGRAIQGALASG